MVAEGISIIICCYNSAERLPETIKHIGLQKISDNISWEVIIVNNNSIDNTREIAEKECQKHQILYSIVDEPQAGLSHARNKGIKSANYEYIIFCDDDNWLQKDYLQIAYNIISVNREIGALGGTGIAVSDIELPYWFADFHRGYAVGKQGIKTGDISYRKFLWGAGMVCRKSALLEAYSKVPSLLTDRKGKELSSGGDSELSVRLLLLGYILYYSEDLVFKHYIPSNRLTIEYRERLFKGHRESNKILYSYFKKADIFRLTRKEKIKLFFSSHIRLFLSYIFKLKKWNAAHENLVIYYLRGFSYLPITKEQRLINQIEK
ncbi:glycosyl transferase family 2 [Pseudopedobacter saltans DSM 12145]|uniref:Glycosyl transferase family 2 n=1 Tax=Pseudopedobacter saltans (strain ATCC 51119 / DSM 12145 / JCM 21818 / CCUG 39354 / LMG 10337 / NBRC 100064 / NCIMB 13643) TaxID=762903 RepID=F0SD79_PSESL|nr:glycosyltransferase [Pseudopedobacter saltans]ADY52865.1 glycosyl transferase family 2 [Pseudopedobacter saltans DSM 12145]